MQVVKLHRRYLILRNDRDGRESILCRACGMLSHHPTDVANCYCGKCHVFHADEDLKERLRSLLELERLETETPNPHTWENYEPGW